MLEFGIPPEAALNALVSVITCSRNMLSVAAPHGSTTYWSSQDDESVLLKTKFMDVIDKQEDLKEGDVIATRCQ